MKTCEHVSYSGTMFPWSTYTVSAVQWSAVWSSDDVSYWAWHFHCLV